MNYKYFFLSIISFIFADIVPAKVASYINSNVVTQGGFRVAHIGNPSTANPHHTIEKTYPGIQALVYETLIEPVLGTDDYNLLIASDIIINYELNVARVIIHPQASFSNGQKITAQDVITSLSQVNVNNTHPYIMNAVKHLSFKIIDDKTVDINFLTPVDTFFKTLSIIPILPNISESSHLIASGPYLIEHIKAKSIHYKKNTHYWGRDLPQKLGRYNFTSVSYWYFQSTFDAHLAFLNNAIDFYVENSASRWKNMKKTLPNKTHTLPHPKQHYTSYFFLNTNNTLLTDPNIRRCFQSLLHTGYLNTKLYHGQYHSRQPAINTPAYRELLHSNLVDLTLLLDKQGITFGKNNIRYKNGLALKFKVLTHNGQWHPLLTQLKQSLRRIGIILNIEQKNIAEYHQALKKQNYDLVISALITDKDRQPKLPNFLLLPYHHQPKVALLLSHLSALPSYLARNIAATLIYELERESHIIPILTMKDFRIALQPKIHLLHHNQSFIDPWSWWIE